MTEQEINKWIETIAKHNQEDLAHVRNMAVEHNADLHNWCVRRLRHEAMVRTAVAACIFIGCCMTWSSSMANAQYDQITTTSSAGSQQICNDIRLAIENI